MANELAGAFEQAGRIWQRCAVKKPHVYMRSEYIDVAEGRISLMRDGSQFTCMLFHPRIDGGIPLDSSVESQQFRSHRRPLSSFEIYGYVAPF